MRALGLSLGLLASLAHADAGWLTTRGRLPEQRELALFVGLRSIGVGMLQPDGARRNAAMGLEASWQWLDRVAEVRATRAWQLNPTGFATSSFTAGVTGLVVPVGQFDLGLGPHVGLNLALGGQAFAVELSALSGLELFVRGEYRFTERLQLGLRAQLGRLALGLSGRAGADLIPGRNFILRADAILSVGLIAGGG